MTGGVQQQSPVREAGKVQDFCLVDVVLHAERESERGSGQHSRQQKTIRVTSVPTGWWDKEG